MKRTFAFLLILSLAVSTLCFNIALASPWSDGFMTFMNMTKSISQYNKSSSEWTTYLSMCDDKLMFIVVINAAANNRDITQIFFIGTGSTVELAFTIDNGTSYILTLPDVDGQYSYHTIYKEEAALVKALGTASKVTITYTTNNKTDKYELSSDEVSNLNQLFGFLDENDFTSAVSSSYIKTCEANSLLYPMTASESDTASLSELNDKPNESGKEISSEITADGILDLLKNSSVISVSTSLSSSKAVPSVTNDKRTYYLINAGGASLFVIYDSSVQAITAVQLTKYMDNPQSLDQINSMFAMVLTLQDGVGAVAINQISLSKPEIGTCLYEFYQAWKQ